MEPSKVILSELQRCCDDKEPEANTVPAWLNKQKFEDGKLFFQTHMFLCATCMVSSLISGLSLDIFLDVLIFTEFSDTPRKAFKRYMSTFAHIWRWHCGDVWDFNKSPANKSILLVRRMHDRVRNDLNKQKGEKPYITQYDMALTQLGFMGAIVTHGRKFGIKCTDYELECYTHFWAGIGYLLGINDKFNVCLRGRDATVQFTKEIEHHLILPALRNPHEKFYSMAESFARGFSLRVLNLNTPESFILCSMETAGYYDQIQTIPMLRNFSVANRLRVAVFKLVTFLAWYSPLIEETLNALFNFFLKKTGYL